MCNFKKEPLVNSLLDTKNNTSSSSQLILSSAELETETLATALDNLERISAVQMCKVMSKRLRESRPCPKGRFVRSHFRVCEKICVLHRTASLNSETVCICLRLPVPESNARVAQTVRLDMQQQVVRRHLHHPVPQQEGPLRGEDPPISTHPLFSGICG